MPFAILPHTADIRLRVTGQNLEEVFRDALRGMAAIQKKEIPSIPEHVSLREIAIEAADTTALLIDFLNEVLSLCTIHKEVYPSAVFYKLTATSLQAESRGIPVSGFDEDIKAVTYHEANIQRAESGEYETIVVFDI